MGLLTIPPPPIESIGPIRMYGITMAIAIAVGLFISHKRYSSRHEGSEAIIDMFLPVVIAGVVGARVYHLFTGYDWKANGWRGVANLRNGGLSIWGAVLFGAIMVFFLAKRKKLSFISLGAAIVPGLLVAQAIGRLGNYFNQELFGRELNAFWALRVDIEYRPAGLVNVATYHPTFLYEMLWCLFLAGAIILCERRLKKWNEAKTIALYITGYCFGRMIWEWLRIDNASRLFGIRFNFLLSLTIFLLGLAWFTYLTFGKSNAKTVTHEV